MWKRAFVVGLGLLVSLIGCEPPPGGEGEGEGEEGEGDEGEGDEGEGDEGEGDEGEGEGEGDEGEGEGEGDGIDASGAVGTWVASDGTGGCPLPLAQGAVGSAIDATSFSLQLNGRLFDASIATTTCTLTSSTDFTCAEIRRDVVSPTCIGTQRVFDLSGTLIDDAFTLDGQGELTTVGDDCSQAPPPCSGALTAIGTVQ